MKTIIYHNPRCSKSREGLCALEDMGQDISIRNYLVDPPQFDEIEHLLQLLNVEPLAIIRQKEQLFLEKFKGKTLSRKEWIEAMVEHPILIERPIVVMGNKAVVGRPPQLIIDFLKQQ